MLRPKPGALGSHGDLEIFSQIEPSLKWKTLFWGIGELSLPIPKTLTDRVAIELSKCLLTLGTANRIIGTST